MADATEERYFHVSEMQVQTLYTMTQMLTASPRDAVAVIILVLQRFCSGENLKDGKALTPEQIGAEVTSVLKAATHVSAATETRQ